MTPTQKTDYVATGYGKCPYCKSDDIVGDAVDINGRHASQTVSCGACEATWTDIYTLSAIQDEKAGKTDDEA